MTEKEVAKNDFVATAIEILMDGGLEPRLCTLYGLPDNEKYFIKLKIKEQSDGNSK